MEFADRSNANSVRFVLLLHSLPVSSVRKTHWDLMIEEGDSLLTFAFESLPPNTSPAEKITWPVTRLADHRRHYLDYEGPIAPLQVAGKAFGGSQSIDHRGSVRRLASGTAVCQIAVCQIADSPIRHKAVRQKVVPQMPVPQTSVVPDKRLVRCRLLSPELEAEFDYANCPINRSTELQLRSWQWIALDDTTAVSLR